MDIRGSGAENTSTDELIAYAYKVNAADVSEQRQLQLFEALHNVYVHYRSQSETCKCLVTKCVLPY